MSTSRVLRRATLGAFVVATASACAPTAPMKAPAAPAKAAAPAAPAQAAAPAPVAAPPAWPANAHTLAADDLRRRVSGKVFDLSLDKGMSARMDYRDSGYVFVNVYPSGASDSGRWRIDGSKVCADMRQSQSYCNEWRAVGDQLMLRRTNGQLVTLSAR